MKILISILFVFLCSGCSVTTANINSNSRDDDTSCHDTVSIQQNEFTAISVCSKVLRNDNSE